MAEPEKTPPKISEIDISNMPKINPDEFKRQAALNSPVRFKVEVMLINQNSMMFEVASGEEAAKFVDIYQGLLERKAPLARWNIGTELYAIPIERIVMIKIHRPSMETR